MPNIELTKNEADRLISMLKQKTDDESYLIGDSNPKLVIDLESTDQQEKFLLNITMTDLSSQKFSYQTRARQSVVLLRLDHGNERLRHRNPDGTFVIGPHLHVYDGVKFKEKVAYPIYEQGFTNTNKPSELLKEFMTKCNVVNQPDVEGWIFE